MAHIALVPDTTLFPDEHLTLVWIGNATQDQKTKAQEICHLFNVYGSITRDTPEHGEPVSFTVNRGTPPHQAIYAEATYQNFGGVMVAVGKVSKSVQFFRDLCLMVGLNASDLGPWKPHITGQSGGWREPGEEVFFKHAILR